MAYEAIQNLEEAKRKFVLLVTHELRSPIGVVHSLLKTLAGGYAGDLSRVQADMVERALRRNEFLQTLVDDLLDVAASKAGLRRSTDMHPVDLARVVCRVYERTIITATEKRIALQLDAAEDSVIIVSGNERSWTSGRQPPVKRRQIHARRWDGEGVAHAPIWQMPGWPSRIQALVFPKRRFHTPRGAHRTQRQGTGEAGTGLGLVIAKEIVTRQWDHPGEQRGRNRYHIHGDSPCSALVRLPSLCDNQPVQPPNTNGGNP